MTTTRASTVASHNDRNAAATHEDRRADPYKWGTRGLVALFTLTLPALLGVIVSTQPGASPQRSTNGLTHGGTISETGTQQPPALLGHAVYTMSCAVCHGPGAEGVKGLGKPLRNSAYVQDSSDEQLFDLIVNGRAVNDPANTTGSLMPPRGAQNLDDTQIHAVVSYLRSIQDPDAPLASVAAWDLIGDAGGTPRLASIELKDHAGFELFVSSCAACHGQGAEGIENQGLPLTTSGFVRSKSDEDLITFIKSGRPVWDPNNTTGIDMPPKGGNPAITDEQLQTIVDYLRALQDKAMGS